MHTLFRAARWAGIGILTLAVLGATGAAGAYFYIAPTLPSTDLLKDVQLQVPLRVYSADGLLIAEYGDKRRSPLQYAQIPQPMVQAVLAAEDDRFFEHPGVDYQGLLRAAIHLIRTGEKGQGGSTITMQVARNFFLSNEKTYLRKLSEIFLALKIERELTKQEILELYLNKIFLGQRAYGVGAAAQVYYGRELADLNPAQFAMIAGLPKAPSAYNPVVNPERALARRNYVLRRMRELGYLDRVAYERWLAEPVSARRHAAAAVEAEAPYLGEMVRAEMVARFGDAAYTAGYRVVTTVPSRLQTAANRSLHAALRDYDRRHGYRGAEAHVALPEGADAAALHALLDPYADVGGLLPAVVTAVGERTATLYTRTGPVELPWAGMAWARGYRDDNTVGAEPKLAADVLAPGDLVRLARDEEGGWVLSQVPAVAGGLVALRPDDGAVLALVGGFDFSLSKFNRVLQAERQPGSSFKPFVYSAALANGFTPGSIINDAPVVFEDTVLESEWRPENYSGHFYGPTRLREALVRSRNLVSIRLLRSTGIATAIRYVSNFGFEPARLSRDLSLALGSAPVTPLELVRGFAVFANGGFRVDPYFITRIEGPQGIVSFEAAPAVACLPCEQAPPADPVAEADVAAPPAQPRLAPRAVEARNVYLITSMMQDVIKRGTGRGALKLGRNDLAGKTGTTNEQRDAWFSGFNRDVVATAWVGFDTPRPLGNAETGARAALPMWVQFMGEALRGVPERTLEQPSGLVTVRIDPQTGLLASAENPEGIFETFFAENVPLQEQRDTVVDTGLAKDAPGAVVTEQLF